MTIDERIWSILIDVIQDDTSVAGLPVSVVEKRVQEQAAAEGIDANKSMIDLLIQIGLDEWLIDKTPDELLPKRIEELGIPYESGFVWHLKILTPEKTELYKSLKPEEKALIRLLREQSDSRRMGILPREIAAQKLEEQGFSGDLMKLYVKDTIDEFMTSWGDDLNVWCYGLVPEYKKTEEYKKWHEETIDRAVEKEMHKYRFTEECETHDPIYGRLDHLAEQQGIDLDKLEMKRNSMDEDEYLRQREAIETRDADEESKWKQIIEMVYELPFDTLIDLRNLLWKGLPSPESVIEFLKEKSKEKKGT
ncbi:MAG: hypothetical protein ACTSW8_10475 [Candidatus Thorarchaeota archaeon]